MRGTKHVDFRKMFCVPEETLVYNRRERIIQLSSGFLQEYNNKHCHFINPGYTFREQREKYNGAGRVKKIC